MTKFQAVDLFSGCGGLSTGLQRAGFWVRAAVDVDPLARRCYRLNHRKTRIFDTDVRKLRSTSLLTAFGWSKGDLDLLAGCPPCQGFSALRTKNGRRRVRDPRNDLVREFGRLALGLRPRAVLMENVPGLLKDSRFEDLVGLLEGAGYRVTSGVLDAQAFGVPQRRRRLILVAGRGFRIDLPKGSGKPRTVRHALRSLRRTITGRDAAHNHGERRGPAVDELIQRIPVDGGGRLDLGEDAQLECHQDFDGFKDVYGRMAWDRPSPTITAGFVNPSKGRFLHPTENRCITIREGALLQGFPLHYQFPMDAGKFPVAGMIGNAVPPAFAEAQGRAIKVALQESE